MKKAILRRLAGSWGEVLGHPNLVRLGSYLVRAGRRDVPNGMEENGESLVQRIVLDRASKKALVVVDCGANVGDWSRQLTRLHDEMAELKPMELFCFEPSEHTFRQLRANLMPLEREGRRIRCIQQALSDRPGMAELQVAGAAAGTNSLVGVPGKHRDTESIRMSMFDDLAALEEIERVHLFKVDAEGFDLNVLEGARGMFERNAIDVVQFEYNWRWIFGRRFLHEAFELLEPFGYSLGKVTPAGVQFYDKYDVRLESFAEGNYLACLSEWVGRFPKVPSWIR